MIAERHGRTRIVARIRTRGRARALSNYPALPGAGQVAKSDRQKRGYPVSDNTSMDDSIIVGLAWPHLCPLRLSYGGRAFTTAYAARWCRSIESGPSADMQNSAQKVVPNNSQSDTSVIFHAI
jgi:hypothetical protein